MINVPNNYLKTQKPVSPIQINQSLYLNMELKYK